MKRFATGVLALLVPFAALAQEKSEPLMAIIVNDGFAFSWKNDKEAKTVVYDVVAAWGRTTRIADCNKYQTNFKGATWCFANETNLKRFIAKTDKHGENDFVPFGGGRCALGASWGRLHAKGDPRTARILKGDRGESVLVLQSHAKWWPEFDNDQPTNRKVAQMRIDFATRLGDIVPNSNEKLAPK